MFDPLLGKSLSTSKKRKRFSTNSGKYSDEGRGFHLANSLNARSLIYKRWRKIFFGQFEMIFEKISEKKNFE